MLQRMEPLRDDDLQRLGQRKRVDCRKRKAEAVEDPGNGANGLGHGLDAWDVSFYGDLLKQEELHLDDEKLKEFFPLEGTIDRILEASTGVFLPQYVAIALGPPHALPRTAVSSAVR